MRSFNLLTGAAVGVLLLGGCALVEGSPEEETASSESPAPEEKGPEFVEVDVDSAPDAFASDAATTFSEESVYDGVVVDDHVVTMTLERLRARTLPELASAWELKPSGLFADITVAGDHLYTLESSPEEGAGTAVGRLSLTVRRVVPESGSVVDEATLAVDNDVQSPGQPITEIVGISGDVVIVKSRGGEEGGRSTLTAIDLQTGDEAWRRRPGSLVAATEDVVVVSTSAEKTPGDLVGLDPETGDRAWRALTQLTSARPVGVLDDRLVVVTSDSVFNTPTLVEVSLEDGETDVIKTVDDAEWSCRPATSPMAVCSLPDERALGYDLEELESTWELPTERRYGVWVTSVNDDHVYGFTSSGKSVVLDAATGRDLSDNPGASPQSTNGHGGLVLYGGKALFYPSVDSLPPTEEETPTEDESADESPTEDESADESPSEDESADESQ